MAKIGNHVAMYRSFEQQVYLSNALEIQIVAWVSYLLLNYWLVLDNFGFLQ